MITHAQMPYRRLRPIERQPMREWLLDLLDGGEVASLSWLDRGKREFRIKWCHGSRHGWSIKDADLFERWAKHTGRYLFGGKKDPKRWKANFRCALNSVKTIEEVRDRSQVKGSNAARIYRMKDGAAGRSTHRGPGSKHKPGAAEAAARRTPLVEEHYHTKTDIQWEPEIKQEVPLKREQSVNTVNFMARTPALRPAADTDVSPAPETKATSADNCLPNFDKISPGIDKIEFGKMHSIPYHSCGFTVKNLLSSTASYAPSINNSSDVNASSGDNNGPCHQPASSSSLGNIRISLPESFQALIAGVGTVPPAAPPIPPLPTPTPWIQQHQSQPTQSQQQYVLPESPEASDASPQSVSHDEEMVEVSLVEVCEEVTLSSQGEVVEGPRGPLTELSPLQWQPLQPHYQADLMHLLNTAATHSTAENNLATTTHILVQPSNNPVTSAGSPTTGWSHGYSPLTPP